MAHEEPKLREEPIIIKKVKGKHKAGHHGGAWKVAYADFVTAMMAFFIVMWILGQSEQVKEAVTSYFKDPGAFNFLDGKRAVPINLEKEAERGKDKKRDKGDFVFLIPPEQRDTLINEASRLLRKKAIEDSVRASKRLETIGETIKKFLHEQIKAKPELKEILSSIKIEMTKEGLRIELIESQESVFFEIGSAKIKEKARIILMHLAAEIGKLPNYVDIEGHTDSRSYGEKAVYSNWELSSDRANSARRLLESNGFWEGQIGRVTGFADRKLRNVENPFDISNRRISILIRQLNVNNFLKQN